MNQKDNTLKLKNKIMLNSDKQSKNNTNKINHVKLKIIEKYNLSPEEADKILIEFEKKRKSDVNYNELNENKMPEKNTNQKGFNTKQKLNNDYSIQVKNQSMDKNPKQNRIAIQNDEYLELDSKNERNIDSILEDFIPNYNQQISIELKHVDLTFEVQNEKIDTLKEAFIRTLKRDKLKKIKIHALNDVSFKIYKGEKVGIIGYNGAGKSTLLNVITGIYPPDKGNVSTYGNISPLLSLGAGFDPNFSGRQNIILNGAVLGYEKSYLYSKIDEIIEFSELGEFIDIPIKNYSSGMLAKLGFSIATAVNPDILIIDEILGVGDVNFMKKSADKIKSLMDGGTTVILVSHSIPQIRELCDKAIWMDGGSLKAMGDVNKICDDYLKDAEKASNEQLANIELVK